MSARDLRKSSALQPRAVSIVSTSLRHVVGGSLVLDPDEPADLAAEENTGKKIRANRVAF